VASGQADERATAPAEVRWGLGDAAAGFVLAWVITAVLTPLIFIITGVDADTPASNIPLRTIALQQVPFDGTMLVVVLLASYRKGRGPVLDFGWRAEWRDVYGLLVGLLTQYAALLL